MGHVGIWLEITDDNDTSAEQKHGSQGSAWGMLRREKVPQGVRRSAGPVLHTLRKVSNCTVGKISALFQRYGENCFRL